METITKAANLKKRIFIVRASDKTSTFPAIFQRRHLMRSHHTYIHTYIHAYTLFQRAELSE